MFKTVINWLTDQLSNILAFVLSILPDSPFQSYISLSDGSEVLGYVNYFLPVKQMIAIGQAWLVAIGVYYVYVAVLRWAKAIE